MSLERALLKRAIEVFGDKHTPDLPDVDNCTTIQKIQRLGNQSHKLRRKIVEIGSDDPGLTMAWQDDRARLYQKARKLAGPINSAGESE